MKSVSWQWVKANPDAAARRIRNLEREVTALREDKDRLDWLCGHLFITRAAIDAERKEGQL